MKQLIRVESLMHLKFFVFNKFLENILQYSPYKILKQLRCILIANIRYFEANNIIWATFSGIFNIINIFRYENGKCFGIIVGFCASDAQSMSGHKIGLQALMKRRKKETLEENRNEDANMFRNDNIIVKLTYLVEIFGRLSVLNQSIQEPIIQLLI